MLHIIAREPERPVTTNDTILADLEKSLRARTGVPAGLTWGDFQHAMRLLGVKDSDTLSSIEFGISQYGTDHIVREDHDGVEIREI